MKPQDLDDLRTRMRNVYKLIIKYYKVILLIKLNLKMKVIQQIT